MPMIPFLIGLTVVGVVGGLAGIYYAKQERSSKRMPNRFIAQPPQ